MHLRTPLTGSINYEMLNAS